VWRATEIRHHSLRSNYYRRSALTVYGFLPPHPANPPTKRPIVALMKQARAFGVGVVIATQNSTDLDYRALSNAGLWCLGRLQTDANATVCHPEEPKPRGTK